MVATFSSQDKSSFTIQTADGRTFSIAPFARQPFPSVNVAAPPGIPRLPVAPIPPVSLTTPRTNPRPTISVESVPGFRPPAPTEVFVPEPGKQSRIFSAPPGSIHVQSSSVRPTKVSVSLLRGPTSGNKSQVSLGSLLGW